MAYVVKTWNNGERVYAADINKWEQGIAEAHSQKLDSSAYTASDVLTKIKGVDGGGSGLDADLLDGQHGSHYATASALTSGLATKLDTVSYNANDILSKVKTVDGDTSGLDADLLDGQHASAFAPASHTQAISTITGLQTALDGKAPTSHNQDWSTIDNKPAQATRWPTWSEVTSKPAEATRWPTWAEVTGKPTTFTPDLSFITYGSTVPSTLPHKHIFIKI